MLVVAPRDLLLLVLINLIWGFNFISSKVGLGEFPPLLFTAMRFGILALVLLPFLRMFRGQMGAIVVAALFSGALAFGLLFVGLSMAENVSTVAIAGQLGVPFTTLLSIILLGEVVHWRRWLGISLSFAGIMVIGVDPLVFRSWQGLALVVLAAFFGSLGLMAVKKLTGLKPLQLQAWIAAVSAPTLLLLSLGFEADQWRSLSEASWLGWAALLFTVLLASLVSQTGYYYLVQRYPVTSVAPMTILTPLFGVFFAVTLLGDQLSYRIAVGGVMTLTGVFIVALRERKIIETGT